MASAIKGSLVLLISLAFVGVAIWLLILGRGGSELLAVIAFFGACAATGVWMVTSRRRLLRQGADPNLDVTVVGGAPITADRRRLGWISAGLVVFGLFLALTGGPIGDGFVAVSLLIAGLGAVVGVLLAFGWRRSFALVFTPAGLRCESPALAYLVAWDGLERIHLGSMNDQPFVALTLRDPAGLAAAADVRRGDPARARVGLARKLDRSQRWFGCDLMISPSAYGLDAVVLLRAIERYAGDPAARAELADPAAIGEPHGRRG